MNPTAPPLLAGDHRLEPVLAPLLRAPARAAKGEAFSKDRVRFEVVRDDDSLQRLFVHWDDLLDQNATRTPFMRQDWLALWWKHFARDHHPFIGAAWNREGDLVALAPFVIGPGTAATRRHLRHLSFFGGLGEVVAEGLDLMVRPGWESVLDPLLDHTLKAADHAWDAAHFGFLDLESPHIAHLHQALERHACDVRFLNEQPSPIIRFAEGGWDTYIMERSGSFRKKYRGLVADSEKNHRVTVRDATHPAEASALLDILMSLHGQRWTAEQSLFLQPRTRAFHADLATLWCPRQRAALLVIEFDGLPVAANYAFVEGTKIWDYQGGWSVDHIQYSPGKLIMAENIRWAMRHGLREYDLLPGDIEYKKKWAKEQRLVADLEAVNPSSLRALVFHSMRAVKRAITHLIPGSP